MSSNVNVSIFIWKAKLDFLSNCFNTSPSAGPGSALSNIFCFLFFCVHQLLEELLVIWGELLKTWTPSHSSVDRGVKWVIDPQRRHMRVIAGVQSCKIQHVAEQPQGGTNSTQRIWSVTSSNKTGHTNSQKMHIQLLQSNMLSMLEFHSNLTSDRQKYFQKNDFCQGIPVCWKWNVFQKCATLNKSAKKTSVVLHLFS